MTLVATTSGAELWTAIAAWVSVGIYAIAAGFAYKQISDARSSRRDQTRPYVFVDFDFDNAPLIYLVLQNVGVTSATDVTFTCDPPMTSSFDRTTVNVLTKTWLHVPPNKKIRYLYDSAIQRFAESSTLPTTYTVTATYYGVSRQLFSNKDEKTQYRDTFVLDLESYRHLMYTREKTLADVVSTLEKLTNQFTSTDGIRVLARDYQDWLRQQEEQREAYRRSSPPKPDDEHNPSGPGSVTEAEHDHSPQVESAGDDHADTDIRASQP